MKFESFKEFLQTFATLNVARAYVGREFNKLVEAGALLYQLMGNAEGGWTTNEKIQKHVCVYKH